LDGQNQAPMRAPALLLVVATFSIALSGCTHPAHTATSTQSPSPSASRPPRAPAAQNPSPSATSAPSVTPWATSPAAAPKHVSALPSPAKKVEKLPPGAAPQILGVDVSETTVAPGDRVLGRVMTSSNVASVEARIGGYAVSLEKVGVGRFELAYKVGPLPWFVHGNFTMQVTARNTRGDSVTRAIPLTVR
jgi:zona occludens toxin (predicted ATPase)